MKTMDNELFTVNRKHESKQEKDITSNHGNSLSSKSTYHTNP